MVNYLCGVLMCPTINYEKTKVRHYHNTLLGKLNCLSCAAVNALQHGL